METNNKRAKITDHFRVALKPQDVNIDRPTKRLKKFLDFRKENIEVITITDDGQEETNKQIAPLEDEATAVKAVVESQQRIPLVDRKQVKPIGTKSSSPINKYTGPPGLGPNVVDYDKISLNDINYEPHYAWDSFEYDRQQEIKFRTRKYIPEEKYLRQTQFLQFRHHDNYSQCRQHYITPHIRAQFVDWLVYAQDNFGLWHETIYMSVKMADQYMMRKTISNNNDLQLLYLTAIFISSKFEERMPSVSIAQLLEFAYPIYTVDDVIRFEVELLTTLKFNLRFPLSWGFLRRYAHCTMSDRKTLSLSRYILESSLYDYEMIEVLESKIAAASLLLASKMLFHEEPWSETAEFYTGYNQEDLNPLLSRLNYLISHPNRRLNAIRTKYSHKVFDSVAKIPPLSSF